MERTRCNVCVWGVRCASPLFHGSLRVFCLSGAVYSGGCRTNAQGCQALHFLFFRAKHDDMSSLRLILFPIEKTNTTANRKRQLIVCHMINYSTILRVFWQTCQGVSTPPWGQRWMYGT